MSNQLCNFLTLFSVFFSPTGHHRRPPTIVFRRLKLQITSSSLSLSILTTNVSSSPPPSSPSSPVLSYVYVLRFSKIQSATTFYTDFEEQRHRFRKTRDGDGDKNEYETKGGGQREVVGSVADVVAGVREKSGSTP